MRFSMQVAVALAALAASGCASTKPDLSPSVLGPYQRLYLTMPSHAAGFGVMPGDWFVSGASTSMVVDQAFETLRHDLIGAGFDVVDSDGEADAVLELTMGGVRTNGDADRAFVAFRDAQTGRLVAFFRARSREDPQSVHDLIDGIAEAIVGMVRDPAQSGEF